MKKPLAVFLILSLHLLSYSQKAGRENVIPESILSLEQGIYMTKEEFLTNKPSIPNYFEVHNSFSDYYMHPDERNDYILTYRDDMGYRKVLGAREVWGYYDGKAVHVMFQGRPYELVHLGAVSILRYHQYYHRSVFAQILSLYTAGQTPIANERIQDVLFHMKSDSVIIPTNRNIRKLLSGDPELFAEYQRERKMDYFEKNLVYLQKYNDKHPMIITETGISLPEPSINVDLVEKN